MSAVPLAGVRAVIYALTWVTGVIAMSALINALVKGNDYVDQIVQAGKQLGVTVYVDTSDIKTPGYVEAVAVGLLGGVGFLALVALLFDRRKSQSAGYAPLSTRTLGIQAASFAFFTIWTFACAIPTTQRIARRSASVKAFIGDVQLPDAVVRAQEQAGGFSRVYWTRNYLRFSAIMVWPAILFGILSAIISLVAKSRASSTAARSNSSYNEKVPRDSQGSSL